MAKEPEKTDAEPKDKTARSAEEATQLEPYPTGDPKGPVTWAEINGLIPVGTGPLAPEEPVTSRATRGDTSSAKKDR